jgi:glycosyltransferase involved in cell wall biosynthesis
LNKTTNRQAPVIIIPAYQPKEDLIGLVDKLLAIHDPILIVVNDGSSGDRLPIFNELARRDRVSILTHAVNLGKGQALKTAFNHALLHFPDAVGVITVDADGQHLPADVAKVAEAMMEHPDALCLGVREFEGDVPIRSRFGNTMTKYVFSFLTGKKIIDTQTGLRGIPMGFLPNLLRIKGHGYEFELEMLLMTCQQGRPIQQIGIKTVYEPHNPTSHFNPIMDSMKIYFVFLRFLSASVLSAFIDTLIFFISYFLSQNILLSMVTGRLVSGSFNFFAVKLMVFKSKGSFWIETIKYIILAVTLMMTSYGLIRASVDLLDMNPYFSKILVETLLFLASFAVQRSLIFAPEFSRH